jgi:hypothetical protein
MISMKYEYAIGPYTMTADVEESIEIDIAEENLPINLHAEIDSAIENELMIGLYNQFVLETNNVVVNEEDITLPPGALNEILFSMAGKFTIWLHEKGIIEITKTQI